MSERSDASGAEHGRHATDAGARGSVTETIPLPAAAFARSVKALWCSDKMDKTVVVAVEDRVEAPALRQGPAADEQAQGARRGRTSAASVTVSD